MAEVENAPEGKAAEAVTIEANTLPDLLKKSFRIKSDRQQEKIQSMVETLVQHALEHTGLISEDVIRTP